MFYVFITLVFIVAFFYGYVQKKKKINQSKRPRVVCAALRFKNGIIIAGVRHFDTTMSSIIEVYLEKGVLQSNHVAEQGFLNSYGKYISREEAFILAKKNGQILAGSRIVGKELFSENIC